MSGLSLQQSLRLKARASTSSLPQRLRLASEAGTGLEAETGLRGWGGLRGCGWPQTIASGSQVYLGFGLAKLTSASGRRPRACAVYASLPLGQAGLMPPGQREATQQPDLLIVVF